MEKSIIAVQGISDIGKTETLNILIDLLSCVAYEYEIKKTMNLQMIGMLHLL